MTHRTASPAIHTFLLSLIVAGASLGAPADAQILPRGIKEHTRPGTDGVEEIGQPRLTALTGLWRGTVDEDGDFGRLRYPIELRFSGSGAQLTLAVRGAVEVPTGDGQKLKVEIEAAYSGTLQGSDLRMRSTRVITHIAQLGESLEGEPQQLEARLEAGMLRGRAGSDDDGWSRFEARAVDAGKVPATPTLKPKPTGSQQAALLGSWTGKGTEPGPDGRPMEYPVTVKISAQGQRIRAAFSSDLQYPVGQGRTTPIEFRARFAGGLDPQGQLALDSESVEYHLVEQRRRETGPKQRLVGGLQNDVLHLRLQAKGEQDSRIELRRVGKPNAGSDTGGVKRPGPSPSADDDNPWARISKPAHEAAGAGRVMLRQHTVRDADLGNVASHTLLMPDGWTLEGGVQWADGLDGFVAFDGAITGPRQEQVHFGRKLNMTFQSTRGQEAPRGAGVVQHDGSIQRGLPQGFGEVASQILLPRVRPGATNVEVLQAVRMPDVEAAFRKTQGQRLKRLEAAAARSSRDNQTASGAEPRIEVFVIAERARLRYEQDGQTWEEEFRSIQCGADRSLEVDGAVSRSGRWSILSPRSCRAPAGALDAALPTLLVLASTLRETPSWSSAILEMRKRIDHTRAQGGQLMMEQAREAATAAAKKPATDIEMEGWRNRQQASDRIYNAGIAAIQETPELSDLIKQCRDAGILTSQ